MTALTPAQCTGKWERLVRNLDDSQKEVVAWVLERELRYLHKVTEDNKTPAMGAKLKVIIPACRMAAVNLVPTSLVDRLARVAAWPKRLTIEEVRAAVDDAILAVQALDHLEWTDTTAEIAFLACPLAERIYESLLAYPGTA